MSRRDLAVAMRRTAAEEAVRGQQLHRAQVTRTNPLTVKLMESRVVLDDDDFELGADVVRWAAKYKFAIGDTVLMAYHTVWMLIHVLDRTEKDHIATNARPGKAGTMPTKHKGTLPAYDARGRLIGRIPLI